MPLADNTGRLQGYRAIIGIFAPAVVFHYGNLVLRGLRRHGRFQLTIIGIQPEGVAGINATAIPDEAMKTLKRVTKVLSRRIEQHIPENSACCQ